VVKIVGRALATSTFGTARRGGPPSVGPEDVKRLKDLERENATLKRFLAEAELKRVALREQGVQRALRPLRPSDPGWATAPRTIRNRGFGPRITTPVQKAGQSIMRQFNAFGARTGFECPSAGGARATAASPPGRSRTDLYSVTRLGAAGASRCA
jgi:hypothetical protein